MSHLFTLAAVESPAVGKFLTDLRQGDAETRLAAVQQATSLGKDVIGPLGQMVSGEDPGAAKAAREALRHTVHHAARPGASAERRAVSAELVKLITKDHPRRTRVEALQLLGSVGGKDEVSAIANQLSDREVFEAARVALESIPDRAAEKALQKALHKVPEEYRPALQQSLRHRRTKWAEVGAAR